MEPKAIIGSLFFSLYNLINSKICIVYGVNNCWLKVNVVARDFECCKNIIVIYHLSEITFVYTNATEYRGKLIVKIFQQKY